MFTKNKEKVVPNDLNIQNLKIDDKKSFFWNKDSIAKPKNDNNLSEPKDKNKIPYNSLVKKINVENIIKANIKYQKLDVSQWYCYLLCVVDILPNKRYN